jgi:metallo-beta-lactamase class B
MDDPMQNAAAYSTIGFVITRAAQVLCIIACTFTGAAVARAELGPEQAEQNRPVAPFRIIGNVYYVGASDVTSYLIRTSDGLILLDGGFAETAPQIKANIATLGFKVEDIKLLLNASRSHRRLACAETGELSAIARRKGRSRAARA